MNKYVPKEAAQAHPGGDNDWYKLYGDDGKGDYSYEKMANGRGGFNFHTGLRSNGCVTSPSEAQEGNANYPHSTKYEQFKEFPIQPRLLVIKTARIEASCTSNNQCRHFSLASVIISMTVALPDSNFSA